MTKPKLKSWQDSRGTVSERALKLIKDKNIRVKDLSTKFNIPEQTIRNLRYEPKRLQTLQVQRTLEFANYYDYLEFNKTMTPNERKKLKSKINSLFAELKNDHKNNKDDEKLIEAIKAIVVDDPIALLEIFKKITGEDF